MEWSSVLKFIENCFIHGALAVYHKEYMRLCIQRSTKGYKLIQAFYKVYCFRSTGWIYVLNIILEYNKFRIFLDDISLFSCFWLFKSAFVLYGGVFVCVKMNNCAYEKVKMQFFVCMVFYMRIGLEFF